jgi:hypothetical protein
VALGEEHVGRRYCNSVGIPSGRAATVWVMTQYVPNVAEQQREERIINDPLHQAESPCLISLLSAIRAANSDSDYLDVQLKLLARLKARQQLITELRAEIDQLGAKRQQLARARPKPVDELRDVQRVLEMREHQERVQDALRYQLLSVGDALAWRRMNCDRAAITILGQGTPVTWLSEGRGWDSETSAVQQLWNEGVLALVTDATTCLNNGDLICFFADRVEIREVKAGGSAPADSPQMQRLQRAINLINDGEVEHEGTRRVMVRSPAPYRTHLAQLPSLIAQAQRAAGRAVRRVSPCQLVVVHDLTLPAAAAMGPFEEAEARRVARWGVGDVILNFGTSLRRMRDRHHRFAYMAPLSILPLRVPDVVDVMLGRLDYTTWVNVTMVARELRGRGWYAEPIGLPDSENGFLNVGVVNPDGRSATIARMAPHLRELMSIELMTAASLNATVEAVFGHAGPEPWPDDVQRAVVLGDEQRVWEREYA